MDPGRLAGLPASAEETLAESGIRRRFGVIIVAIRQPDGHRTFPPGSRTEIGSRAAPITVGPEEDQRRLAADCG
jgi:K+/H+ antiporter YhaU regulatory subunit KhtT